MQYSKSQSRLRKLRRHPLRIANPKHISLKNYCEGNHVLANKVSVFTPVTQPKKKSFTGIIDIC